MYLLDTNVISLLDPKRVGVPPSLLEWLNRNGNALYLSAMTITELEAGVLKLRREQKDVRAAGLSIFIERVLNDFGSRVLPIDAVTALTVARLAELARPRVIELADLLIAATARRHDLTLLTANTRHFEGLGLKFVNPLDPNWNNPHVQPPA